MTKRILFVCLGNICRSPLAEGIAKRIIDKNRWNIEVDSAGTGAWHVGEPPCSRSVDIAARYGIDISTLRARQIQSDDKQRFDMIIAMDSNNQNILLAQGFQNVEKLGNYGGYLGMDVPDPYYFDDEKDFEKVYHMIAKSTEALLQKVSYENA